jgi:hypothetical protein
MYSTATGTHDIDPQDYNRSEGQLQDHRTAIGPQDCYRTTEQLKKPQNATGQQQDQKTATGLMDVYRTTGLLQTHRIGQDHSSATEPQDCYRTTGLQKAHRIA